MSEFSPAHTPVDLHPAMDGIRRLPEFQPPKPGFWEELYKLPWVKDLGERLQDVLKHFTDELSRFLSHVRPPVFATMPETMRDLFSGFVGFVLVLLGLYAFYIVLGWLLRLKERSLPPPPPTVRVVDQTRLVSSSHHVREAGEQAQSGRYEEATRQLYFALLCLLDERKLVPFENSRSNRDYADRLHGQKTSELQAGFLSLAGQFEAVRYGKQPAGSADYARCQALYQKMEAQTDHD